MHNDQTTLIQETFKAKTMKINIGQLMIDLSKYGNVTNCKADHSFTLLMISDGNQKLTSMKAYNDILQLVTKATHEHYPLVEVMSNSDQHFLIVLKPCDVGVIDERSIKNDLNNQLTKNQIIELAKKAINYDREVEMTGKTRADGFLHGWVDGYYHRMQQILK